MIKNSFFLPFFYCIKSAPVDPETRLVTPYARCVPWHHGTRTVAHFGGKIACACVSFCVYVPSPHHPLPLCICRGRNTRFRVLRKNGLWNNGRTEVRWGEWLWNRCVEAIRSSTHSFARAAHSFACSALLASLASSATLIRSFARSLTYFEAHEEEVFVYELNVSISYHFNPQLHGLMVD